jgi:ribosome maturation factor RimP
MMSGGSRSAAGPADEKRLAGLIQPVAEAAGMDLESVRVSVAGQRRLLRIIVDSDAGVSLDDAADISREISKALDAAGMMGEVPYNLEVSSPGVSRPLTEPRHWRRAAGRLVKAKVHGEGTLRGRITATDGNGVTLDVDGARRDFAYGDLGPGTVQVEFDRIPDADLAGEGLADDDHPGDGAPDEVFPDTEPAYDDADLGAGGDGH